MSKKCNVIMFTTFLCMLHIIYITSVVYYSVKYSNDHINMKTIQDICLIKNKTGQCEWMVQSHNKNITSLVINKNNNCYKNDEYKVGKNIHVM